MKKYSIILRYLVAVVILSIISLNSHAQSSPKKEGEAVYDVTMSMGGMSQQMDIKFKDDEEVTTMEISIPTAGKMVNKTFYDAKEKKTYSFIDVKGKKYEMEMTPEDAKAAMKSNPMSAMFDPDSLKVNFKRTDTIANVLGHSCHKYTGSNKLISMEVYACDSLYIPSGSLNNIPGSQGVANIFEGINGGILKYIMSISIMGMNMQFTSVATKISYGHISNSEFKMPKGYKKVTMQELQQMMTSGNE